MHVEVCFYTALRDKVMKKKKKYCYTPLILGAIVIGISVSAAAISFWLSCQLVYSSQTLSELLYEPSLGFIDMTGSLFLSILVGAFVAKKATQFITWLRSR